MKRGTTAADTRQMSFELSLGPATEANVAWDTSLSEIVKNSVAPSTGDRVERAASGSDNALEVSAERAYPHIYDAAAGESGAAMSLVAQAKQEIAAAIQAWTDADLEEVCSKLTQLATTLAAAHRHTQFNESFGATVSFIRRAALQTNVNELDMPSLMLLAQSLNVLYAQPMLTLDSATDLIEKLQYAGWNGRHAEVAAFVEALVGTAEDVSSATEQAQHASQD